MTAAEQRQRKAKNARDYRARKRQAKVEAMAAAERAAHGITRLHLVLDARHWLIVEWLIELGKLKPVDDRNGDTIAAVLLKMLHDAARVHLGEHVLPGDAPGDGGNFDNLIKLDERAIQQKESDECAH